MAKLPRPLVKLDCLYLKMMLSKRVEDIQNRKKAIIEACSELRESPKLKLLLEAVLMIGNTLNNQNEEVNRVVMVRSFTMTSLANLSGTKGFDKKTSLLMFLEKVLAAKLPEVFLVYDELPHLVPASRESFDGIRQDEDGLRDQLESVTNELNQSRLMLKNDTLQGDEKSDLEQSITELEEFASTAQNTLSKLRSEIEDTKTVYDQTLTFFGQDSTLKSDEFFACFIKFFDELLSVHRKMEEMRERLNNKLKKQKEMEVIKKGSLGESSTGNPKRVSKEMSSEISIEVKKIGEPSKELSKESSNGEIFNETSNDLSKESSNETPNEVKKINKTPIKLNSLHETPSTIPSVSFDSNSELVNLFNNFQAVEKQSD